MRIERLSEAESYTIECNGNGTANQEVSWDSWTITGIRGTI
ncbi:MAG: hypothetical protein Sylvanvirus13_15 [Sylvanvirus sp.]|uniref:Uncharacterized protein n=1 Tax=Sylvanvirus sp. TaxID=2487774 RepID=A0A3G5AIC4_9VIRU|nr:MAG: hypothetical protein Sylvanvirus13_15 [Sylvanvirus sp.]